MLNINYHGNQKTFNWVIIQFTSLRSLICVEKNRNWNINMWWMLVFINLTVQNSIESNAACTGAKYNCINGISLAFNSLHCLTTNINLSPIIRIVQVSGRNKKHFIYRVIKFRQFIASHFYKLFFV